jgi:hypothetical protein
MVKIVYETATGRTTVLVGTDNVIEAQQLAKASDVNYQKMVDFSHEYRQVWFVREEKQ